jgi:hypothetical protein
MGMGTTIAVWFVVLVAIAALVRTATCIGIDAGELADSEG